MSKASIIFPQLLVIVGNALKESRDFNRDEKKKIRFIKKTRFSFYRYFEQTVH